MPSIRNHRKIAAPPAAVDDIEQSFLDALARLKAGKPKNKEIADLFKRGALRIGITTVAKEAGHSRTLIGHKACKYPNVRDCIMALKSDPENPTRLQDVVSRRREEAAKLRRLLALAQTQNATLLARIVKLDVEVLRLSREVERLRTRKPAATVVQLPRRD
jgi:hypothetical protein